MRHAIYRTLISLGVFSALNLLIALCIDSSPVKSSNHKYLTRYRRWLESPRTEVVLIGNSMLGAAVDTRELSNRLQKPCVKLAKGGSASAAWFLTFKNAVLTAKHTPKSVIFFFRDSFLTRPRYRTAGTYKKYIDDQSTETEPLLDELVYTRNLHERFLNRTLPSFAKRSIIKNRLNRWIKETVAGGLLTLSPSDIDDAVGRVLHRRKMRKSLATKQQEEAERVEIKTERSFANRVDRSFLPHIIKLAKHAGINLFFVRIKRHRDLTPNAEESELKQYIKDLRSYFHAREIPFIDFTEDERIKSEHYADGDHLNTNRGRDLFTKILAEALKPYL